ncbi:sodium:solute symporter family transporter [Pseudoalteromonas piratica]|uniref:sodium:solute symporter family transporter n=1 Tax=Pseudoalteromonas piratica TaxID=1348114 RepID=UPI000B206D9D|nr:hypothetical protein [Pseudoalteromonas piratica]
MSTISSQLLVSSSSLVEDIYKSYSKRQPSSQELLTISRVFCCSVRSIVTAACLT